MENQVKKSEKKYRLKKFQYNILQALLVEQGLTVCLFSIYMCMYLSETI